MTGTVDHDASAMAFRLYELKRVKKYVRTVLALPAKYGLFFTYETGTEEMKRTPYVNSDSF